MVIGWMKEAGLTVRMDNVGNICGRMHGSNSKANPIMTGSHIDTQANAGCFDGVLGVLGAIEVLMTMKENGIITQHPVEVVVFTNEEGVRFAPATMGSKAVAGILPVEKIYEERDSEGISYLEALSNAGIELSNLTPALRTKGDIEAFIELHVEQAPYLDMAKIPIGIVTSIVGVRAFDATIIGRADHQALRLDLRKDALVGAAEVVLAVNQTPRRVGHAAVGLVGRLTTYPGMRAVVPERVEFTIDLRDITQDALDRLENRIRRRIARICEKTGLQYDIKNVSLLEPTIMSERVMSAIECAAAKLGIPSKRVHSGAGHDSQNMARITDTGMIFVPSKDGRSHCPEEWTEWNDVKQGCDVLMHSLLELDRT
jgi:allantoate deiminase